MARLQVIEDNPWEEEWRKRDKEEEDNDEEEELENIKSSHHNTGILPSRSIPMRETRTQKGLSLIFGKVDRQIELLDKQVNTVQAELLQARTLVMAVRSTVANLNKPEASNLLEEDAFTNYLRIADRLKAISNNIFMIIPDHGRQIVRTQKAYTYNPGFVYSNSELDEPDPEPSIDIDEWTARETYLYGYKFDNMLFESAFNESSSSESVSSDFAPDLNVSPPLPRSPTREWYAPNRARWIRRPSPSLRVGYERRRQPILRNRHTVHFARTPRSRVSSAFSSRDMYDSPSDSSSMNYWQRENFSRPSRRYPYYPSKGRVVPETRRSHRSSFIPSTKVEFEPQHWQVNESSQIPLEEPSVLSAMPKVLESTRRAVRAASRSRHPLSYRSESTEQYEIEPREGWVEEEIEIPPEEPRLVSVDTQERQQVFSLERTLEEPRLISVDPKKKRQAFSLEATQEKPRVVSVGPKETQRAFSLEAILHEERTLLLEKLYKVQEQLEATQRRPIVKSLISARDDIKGSVPKEKFWTRLRSKFVDHSKQQDGHDLAA
ncbi:uncharacterized protein BHQ10_006551 [Talaromyces amestolkiae]|uniref:Uncharacterized protein n=1 Tax=Talaromyces amestolkiae TaxID=1196081 RepID=A0A364L3Z6_TALAM|nr:uncharacterized protein BHQ10_006551 [Talaromyces amestolkiae]RAO70539.1 hypothetical protein BHQ10_006551 [Talaromyces amestolkiae]